MNSPPSNTTRSSVPTAIERKQRSIFEVIKNSGETSEGMEVRLAQVSMFLSVAMAAFIVATATFMSCQAARPAAAALWDSPTFLRLAVISMRSAEPRRLEQIERRPRLALPLSARTHRRVPRRSTVTTGRRRAKALSSQSLGRLDISRRKQSYETSPGQNSLLSTTNREFLPPRRRALETWIVKKHETSKP
jgi:hypothetical protein